MAIVESNAPTDLTSCQDSLWHTAVSDASGLTNFKYIFDIYDNNGTKIVRTKIYPDVQDGWGYFDASSVVKNEVSYQWFKCDYTLGLNQKNLLKESQVGVRYRWEIGEEYNIGASGIISVNQASGYTQTLNYFTPLFKRRVDDINTLFYGKFFTNKPKYCNTSFDENILIGFNYMGSTTLLVKKYNQYNTLLSTNSKSFTFSSVDYHQINIGMKALNTEFGSSIFSSSDDGYYTVTLNGQTYRVNIKCVRDYPPINLHFINAYGVFDTARFDCTNKLNMSISRKRYEQKDVSFSTGDVNYLRDSKIYNETTTNYASEINWTYKLQMDFPTDAEWEWLSELIYSPQVYMEKDGYFYPVTIKATNYEYYKQIYSKLKTFELEVEINQKRNGFRR